MNERFAALLFLPAGLALALVLDALVRWRPRGLGTVLAVAVAAACLTPFALNATSGLPYPRRWCGSHGGTSAPRRRSPTARWCSASRSSTRPRTSSRSRRCTRCTTRSPGDRPRVDRRAPGRRGARLPGHQALASTALAPNLAATATPLQRAEVLAALDGWGVTSWWSPSRSVRTPRSSHARRRRSRGGSPRRSGPRAWRTPHGSGISCRAARRSREEGARPRRVGLPPRLRR